jgi:hypothetical protein
MSNRYHTFCALFTLTLIDVLFPLQTGTYSASVGTAECSLCSKGTYSKLEGSTSCLPCNAGTRGQTAGAVECGDCLVGTYQGASGQAMCTVSPAGKFVNTTGQSYAFDCLPGTYSSAQSSTCNKCALGTYQSTSGQSSCIECAPGTAASDLGSVECSVRTCIHPFLSRELILFYLVFVLYITDMYGRSCSTSYTTSYMWCMSSWFICVLCWGSSMYQM